MYAPAPTLATNSNAVRQRNFRARNKQGRKVFSVDVSEQVLQALIAAGCLSATETLDQTRVREELTAILDHWALHWEFT
jgi:hypothetical protein